MSMPSKSVSKEPAGFIQRIAAAFIIFILICLLIGAGHHVIASSQPEWKQEYEEIDAHFAESFYYLLEMGDKK